ncbi:MAG: AIR synthase-related protein, partial [Tepidisphaeraceae bacterium]
VRGTGFQPVKHGQDARATTNLGERLLALLRHPNIASKHWIIRQYDHEVQGGSVIKPLVGPHQVGPSDASVIRPKLSSHKGVVVACGLVPHVEAPYAMAIAAIDEAVRNAVCVGADLDKLAVLDNFCWPSVDDERTMGALVAACEACRDAALAYGIPFISGKDSLHNQFTNSETGEVIRIPNTLLISAIGVIDDVRRCVTMDLKDPREGTLLLVTPRSDNPSLSELSSLHRAVSRVIRGGHAGAVHDVSDGGYLVSMAEMCIASGLGSTLSSDGPSEFFAEGNGGYVMEVHAQGVDAVEAALRTHATVRRIGRTTAGPSAALAVSSITPGRSEQFDLHVFVDDLTRAWRGTLDW